MTSSPVPTQLTLARITKTWWPLAASWLLMSMEGPALSAVMARLPNPETSLAAYGGVVFPIALIVEAPIIMLLAASTALCKDWDSYARIRRFMMASGAILTLLHALVAFTPLYDLLVRQVIGVPEEIIEPGRMGLMVMLPWTFSIAYRRFHQGVMIRFGASSAVWVGTLVRLISGAVVLAIGYSLGGTVPGIIVGTAGEAAGVMSEALYVGLRVRPILRHQVRLAPAQPPVSWRAFASFYTPLAMTSFLGLVWQPVGSAALSRMALPLESLAVWPVLSGLLFMLRSAGNAFNEVVVALLDEPGSSHPLRRFAAIMGAGVTVVTLLVALTSLSMLWFSGVSALPPDLAEMARIGLLLMIPIPGLTVYQSWYQGSILFGKRTRAIPESIGAFLVGMLLVFAAGLLVDRYPGIYVAALGMLVANAAQTAWLWQRSLPVMRFVGLRDARDPAVPAEPNPD